MIDSYLLGQIAETQATIDRLTPALSWIQESAERAAQFSREVEARADLFKSAFEKLVLHDRTLTHVRKAGEDHNRVVAAMEQHRQDQLLISVALPKRGWYLSGEEPCTLSQRLAKAIRDGNWDLVDQQMMKHLPQYEVDTLRQWLAQEGVPEHCINRLGRFLRHHQEGNHEEATYLGVPLLDEVALYLYRGRCFTTKRGKRRRCDQSKPEIAFKTASGPDLASYCESFVQAFGSLQEDPDQARLADENYWNRHAIVHGLMQRAMGVKDSAKCLMAMGFLFFARREDKEDALAQKAVSN